MVCIQTVWHWYNTVATTDSLTRPQDTALFAIASVSAVVWTGGLISGQIKQWSVVLPVSLDLVQCAFMGAIFRLFIPALGFRYLVTAFLLYYIVASVIGLWRNRNANWIRAKLGSKLTMLTDEQWNNLAKTGRTYSVITLASLALFAVAIIWPYPTAISWVTAFALLLGYQLIIYYFAATPDKNAGIGTALWMANEMTAIRGLLKQLVEKS